MTAIQTAFKIAEATVKTVGALPNARTILEPVNQAASLLSSLASKEVSAWTIQQAKTLIGQTESVELLHQLLGEDYKKFEGILTKVSGIISAENPTSELIKNALGDDGVELLSELQSVISNFEDKDMSPKMSPGAIEEAIKSLHDKTLPAELRDKNLAYRRKTLGDDECTRQITIYARRNSVNPQDLMSTKATTVRSKDYSTPPEMISSSIIGYDHTELMLDALGKKLGINIRFSEEEVQEAGSEMHIGDITQKPALKFQNDMLLAIKDIIAGKPVEQVLFTKALNHVCEQLGGVAFESSVVSNLYSRYTKGIESPQTQPAATPEAASQPSSTTEDSPQIKALKEENARLKAGQANNNSYQSITGDVTHDIEVLKGTALRTFVEEVSKSDSIFNLLYTFLWKGEKGPETTDKAKLAEHFSEKIFGSSGGGLTQALAYYLLHRRGETNEAPTASQYKLEGIQKGVFSCITKAMWISQYIPSGIINTLGKAKLAAPFVSSIISRLPFGGLLNTAFLAFNEYVVSNLVFHQSNLQTMLDISEAYKPKNKEQKTEQAARTNSDNRVTASREPAMAT